MKTINIDEIKESLNQLNEIKSLFDLINNAKKTSTTEVIEHGCCVVVLDKGFIYLGYLETDGKFLTIKKPFNIRNYTSGKGLLWHVVNGSEDMTLDYANDETVIKAPYSELKHFIPTDEKLWY